jgi:hypothetical protein
VKKINDFVGTGEFDADLELRVSFHRDRAWCAEVFNNGVLVLNNGVPHVLH